MNKIVYAYIHTPTGKYGKFSYDRGQGYSCNFLHQVDTIDQTTFFKDLAYAEETLKECAVWDTAPCKEDWKLIQVEIAYKILQN